ncbi:MAG TPA: thiamine diphosphokinase, partial [Acidimicrobiia bacterium]
MTTVVVLGGGPDRPALIALPPGATVIAADGGAELARAFGLRVELAVGDFDSISAETLGSAARVERHPPDKDATDLELALSAAQQRGVDEIVVVGGAGGRLDHFLANVMLLGSSALADTQVSARLGEAEAVVVRDSTELHGRTGDL